MFPEAFMDHELPCKLMVNGIPVQSVHSLRFRLLVRFPHFDQRSSNRIDLFARWVRTRDQRTGLLAVFDAGATEGGSRGALRNLAGRGPAKGLGDCRAPASIRCIYAGMHTRPLTVAIPLVCRKRPLAAPQSLPYGPVFLVVSPDGGVDSL